MRTLSSVLAAVALPVASGVRKTVQRHGVATKTVAGVPIYNYESRHLQLEKGSEAQSDNFEFDWFLAFDKTTDTKLNDFCKHDIGKAVCTRMGHPSASGTPFVMIRSNEDNLRHVLESNSDQVLFAEPDLPVDIPEINVDVAPSSPSSSETPWSLGRIGQSRSPFTGKGVHIYVMDTGVRSTHTDFGGRALPTVDTFAGEGDAKECYGDVNCATDYHGHGTHVAGSAGGRSYGAAPESNLYVMKVCCGQYTNVHGGMDWVAENGIRPVIMTVSLASKEVSQASKLVVDNAVAAGVTVFVGAANDDVDTCTMTYGFIPSAISIGATDSRDQRATFSNWGTCNDIYAPGVAILSAWKDSDTQTKIISGTSMATPLAAGVGALILEENPSLTPEEVLQVMLGRSLKGVITSLMPGDPNLLLSAV